MKAVCVLLFLALQDVSDVGALLDSGHYDRAATELEGLDEPSRSRLRARYWFEVGDFVACSRAAAEGLRRNEGDRELLWWGTRASLWLGDGDTATTWVERLRTAAGSDPEWRATIESFEAAAGELTRDQSRAHTSLIASRIVTILGTVTGAGLFALAMRARSEG
ncbi:MAG: hypothetical protein R3F34_17575 [Planctomycetota bacterium]